MAGCAVALASALASWELLVGHSKMDGTNAAESNRNQFASLISFPFASLFVALFALACTWSFVFPPLKSINPEFVYLIPPLNGDIRDLGRFWQDCGLVFACSDLAIRATLLDKNIPLFKRIKGVLLKWALVLLLTRLPVFGFQTIVGLMSK